MKSNMDGDIRPQLSETLISINDANEPVISESVRIFRNLSDDQQFGDSENKCSEILSFSSKKEQKRHFKLQRRLQMSAEWKLQRKLKNKERKTRNKLSGLSLKKKITPMSNSERKFTIVIDFSYDELMSFKDLIKCGNQVTRCYSVNRRSSNPVQLHFCHFTGKIVEAIGKNNGYQKWDINFHENGYMDVFKKSDLVYLTSESRNVLETLEEDKVYIIGGLVDHNAHKGVSYQKAVYEGISHAQLPLKKYVQMRSRSVLTVNHVFEILLRVSNGESWSKALLNVIPPRFCETNFNKKTVPANEKNMSTEEEELSDDETSVNAGNLPTSKSTSEITADVNAVQEIIN